MTFHAKSLESQPSPTTPVSESQFSAPEPIGLREAFWFWLKLGFISFGGPAGQISIMHSELVERRRWISEKRFLHALNYCMLLPGPEAQQLATYLGWLLHRTKGGILAGVLFVLPSLFILIILSWLYLAFGQTLIVMGLFYGIKPAVVAIVFQAVHRMGSRALKGSWMWAMASASFICIFALNVPFPAIVAGAALIGYMGGRWMPERFQGMTQHKSAKDSYGPALIDDHSPIPKHAQFCWPTLVKVLGCGLLLWILPMLALSFIYEVQHPFVQMALFFTKAAFLTFGGAYAVLPYVYQGAVVHYGWLGPTQMVDGLALGETTPGPLIMVVAFVGFVGGYSQALLGQEHLFLAGASAAMLVTWFTFLPSFVFILAGGPLVESTRSNLKLSAPWSAITAAVVGVILNLALFFGYHVLWPQSFSGPLDLFSAGLIALAALLLFRYKRSVIEVIVVSALMGLGLKTLGI